MIANAVIDTSDGAGDSFSILAPSKESSKGAFCS